MNESSCICSFVVLRLIFCMYVFNIFCRHMQCDISLENKLVGLVYVVKETRSFRSGLLQAEQALLVVATD